MTNISHEQIQSFFQGIHVITFLVRGFDIDVANSVYAEMQSTLNSKSATMTQAEVFDLTTRNEIIQLLIQMREKFDLLPQTPEQVNENLQV